MEIAPTNGGYCISDKFIYTAVTTQTIKKAVKTLKNKTEAYPNAMQYATDLLKAMKQIPKNEAKYIYTRFFGDTVSNKHQTAEVMGLTVRQIEHLHNTACRSLVKVIYQERRFRVREVVWSTIETSLGSDISNALFSLEMQNLNAKIKDYEVLNSTKLGFKDLTEYELNVTWFKYEEKGEF